MITRQQLNDKARKQIIGILIIGFLLLVTDYVLSGNLNTLALFKSDKGLYMVRPEDSSGEIRLHAEVKGKDGDIEKSFTIRLDPYTDNPESPENQKTNPAGEMSREELVNYRLKALVNSMNEDSTRRRVYLPSHLDTGDEIKWSVVRQTNTAAIAFAVIALSIFIYRNRLNLLKKELAAQQDSVSRQLPEFLNRLLLLLNAGLVLNSAFEKAIEDSSCIRASREDYFYGKMREIQEGMRQANSSFDKEFRAFARSRRDSCDEGSRELMRISNIISDNISKGVELTDKLQIESESLWLARKQNCEERGRLAETKLTFPLTLFLLVLIAITVSPALLEL